MKLDAAPASDGHQAILSEAFARWPDVVKPLFKGGPDIVCLSLPEQEGYTVMGRNWLPVVRQKVKDDGGTVKVVAYFCRPDRALPEDIVARTPRLSPLADKTALVVGLGALGSTIAWQLARAGIGNLRFVDQDTLEIGNTSRWLLGKNYVGLSKVGAMYQHLSAAFPYLTMEPEHCLHLRIGSPHMDPAGNEALQRTLEGVDLIIDATAAWSVNHYLSTQAQTLRTAFVWATATHGSWGGAIGRVLPSETEGCWRCYQRHLYDGTIPIPQQEPGGEVQPYGCYSPTFTGAGFDLDHVSLGAVRLAVASLCNQPDSYPNFPWDVGILSLWDVATGLPLAANWNTFQLTHHRECDCV